MIELELTHADVKRIKGEVRLTLILGLLLTIGLVAFLLIIPAIMTLLGKPASGFIKRALIIIGLLSLPLVGLSWKNIVKYIDVLKRKKIRFKTLDYEIRKEKNGFVLCTKTPLELKFNLYDKLQDLIKLGEPITLESTRVGKTLLCISQDSENLLEKIEREYD